MSSLILIQCKFSGRNTYTKTYLSAKFGVTARSTH